MTTQEKIDVLEKAIPLIDTSQANGICGAIQDILDFDYVHDGEIWLSENGLTLPESNSSWCWPLTPEGDEQRRQFLRYHIEILKKEL